MLFLGARAHQLVVVGRMLVTISFVVCSVCIGITSPTPAKADALDGSSPVYSTTRGLPNSRVYEQVSPANKNGNEAGVNTNPSLGFATEHYALAAPDGDGILFEGNGPMGETTSGFDLYFEAQRSGEGWSTRGVFPRTQESASAASGTINVQPFYVDPSADLSHVMFKAEEGFFASPPYPDRCESAGGRLSREGQLFLSGPDPALAAVWLARPEIPNPIEDCLSGADSGAPVGGSHDFNTIYFTFPGTLLPEDAPRASHVPDHQATSLEPWGFYEYSKGILSEAGVLPDGSLDPFGAVPAVSGHGRAPTGNQVSTDGSRAFFVSPDPASCGNGNDCVEDPPELYVRENGERTVLVSRDDLLADENGPPTGAPDGALGFTGSASQGQTGLLNTSYVYASPDGDQAFFESDDDLTDRAREISPGLEPKMYDFEVDSGLLKYLPGVMGQIVSSSPEGSSFVFVSPGVEASSAELDLWSTGPNGDTVTPITSLNREAGTGLDIPVARMSNDGSSLVFASALRLPGGSNSGTGLEQIYRYDVSTNTLNCISCPPQGIDAKSNAELSRLQRSEVEDLGALAPAGLVEERGISSNGEQIFFDTADPLVPQDSNGLRDVYEWDDGTIYLISSGKSTLGSYFLDNSESGGDVFFATAEGLVPSDTDGAYDVYDARIPRAEDRSSPATIPCEGSVCQGPPRVPTPIGAPASTILSGLGNAAVPASKRVTKPASRPLTRAQKLSAALKSCRRQAKKKRARCELQARRRYAPEMKRSTRRGK